MKIAIRYYTKTGNTKKLAESIANVVNVEAKTVDEPLTEDVDIQINGSAGYFVGTMVNGPKIHINGNVGWFAGDNMTVKMSSIVEEHLNLFTEDVQMKTI